MCMPVDARARRELQYIIQGDCQQGSDWSSLIQTVHTWAVRLSHWKNVEQWSPLGTGASDLLLCTVKLKDLHLQHTRQMLQHGVIKATVHVKAGSLVNL
mmetsp:Transcript_19414/g.58671  ORF Transcript_19414/g.58671 Transcript_19414/m.58671 type:complete len:99 (+) Transcript_19414:932-1228(+)